MAAEPALALNGVTKRFGGLAVCDGIGFVVPAGARMALIGPNGAGKTTLFNMISGVYGIDSGSIMLHGQPIHDLPPRKRVPRRAVALVSEHPADAAPVGDRKHHARAAHACEQHRRAAQPAGLAAQQLVADACRRQHATGGPRRRSRCAGEWASLRRAQAGRGRTRADEPAAGADARRARRRPQSTRDCRAVGLSQVGRVGRPNLAGRRARHVLRARPLRPHRRSQFRPPDLRRSDAGRAGEPGGA